MMSSVDGQDTLTVTAQPYSINAEQGSSQTLRCQYNIPAVITDVRVEWLMHQPGAPPKLVWNANNTPSSLSQNNPHNSAELEYKGRLTGTSADFPDLWSGHSLTFLRVELHDEGIYFCTVFYYRSTGSHNQGQSNVITLTVQGKFIC